MTYSSRADRAKLWERLGSESFDVVVVGGGITGAGVARDAALRGLRVALVEKDDFAQGTSSRSSRLVHGGLRYLEQYEFGLVRESTAERALLMRLAPHLVRPLPFVYPVYEGRGPGMFMMGAGLWLYDLLAMFRSYRRHRRVSSRKLATLEPEVRQEGLKGAYVYHDCLTDDGRLTLENILDATANGAVCLSRVSAVRGLQEEGRTTRLAVEDRESGARTEIQTGCVVQAVGPWTDELMPQLDETAKPMMLLSKGCHIVFPRSRLPVEHAVVMMVPRDGRVTFCVPWGTATYVGTTDTELREKPDEIAADSDDVAYLLEVVRHYFPSLNLGVEDVISTWAGVRPLISEGAGSTYDTSREHEILTSPTGVVTVAGGKLTTYRRMAAETVDAAVKVLEKHDAAPELKHCETGQRPLPGGVGLNEPKAREELQARLKAATAPLDAEMVPHIFHSYGARATELLAIIADDSTMAEPLVHGLPYLRAEVRFAAREEMVVHLEDFMVRRTHLLYVAPRQGRDAARAIAADLAVELGWDDARTEAELQAYDDLASRQVAGVVATAGRAPAEEEL